MLFLNILVILIMDSWQLRDGIRNPIFTDYKFFWINFSVIGTCFVWLLREKITLLSLTWKEGFRAELKQIQQEKDEIIALKKEIRELAVSMLESHVTIIQNSNRWSGWSEKRLKEAMEKIQSKCKNLNCDPNEKQQIFQTKSLWDKIDRISIIKDQIVANIAEDSKKNFIHAEWNTNVGEQEQPDGFWLIKFLDDTSLNQERKQELIASIHKERSV